MFEIQYYLTESGVNVFERWLDELRDERAVAKIAMRFARVHAGNFGDHKPIRDGIWELRVDTGPGYRVYYGRIGARIVLLLCGGDKRTQAADIDRAVDYWKDFRRRSAE